MITLAEMRAEVDRHLNWMVRPGGPNPQRVWAAPYDADPLYAEATFLVGGDEVTVTAEEGEGGRGYVEITVYEPNHKVAFAKFLDYGEDLDEKDREYITTLLADMGTRVRFPVEESRTKWQD